MEPQPVILLNVDIAFATNLLTDLAWLWATSALAGLPIRWRRLTLAAAAGSALAVWAYFPSGRWLAGLPGVLLGSLTLLGLAFWPCRMAQGLRATAWFLFTGGAMAGIVLATGPHSPVLAAGGVQPREFPGAVVAAGVLLCLLGGRYLWEAARVRSRISRGLCGLRVTLGSARVELPALLDTGNRLRDPLSGRPVAVVALDDLAHLLPAGVARAAARGWESAEGIEPDWRSRCRLVPYRAVGKPTGVLLAVAADQLEVRLPGATEWGEVRGLVGLSPEPLHPEGLFQALLPPDLAGGSTTWEGETG